MTHSKIFSLTLLTMLCGCSAKTIAPPPQVASSYNPHVYRLDFVLSASDGAAPQTTSFSLTLGEHDKGDVILGKNVPLNSNAPSLRQDVGVKVVASIGALLGEDVMLDVSTEVSAFDPPTTIRKISAIGKALAAPGKSTVVAMLEEDQKTYKLSVTPTKLR